MKIHRAHSLFQICRSNIDPFSSSAGIKQWLLHHSFLTPPLLVLCCSGFCFSGRGYRGGAGPGRGAAQHCSATSRRQVTDASSDASRRSIEAEFGGRTFSQNYFMLMLEVLNLHLKTVVQKWKSVGLSDETQLEEEEKRDGGRGA